jgi:uncharacterized protein with HEPN domain
MPRDSKVYLDLDIIWDVIDTKVPPLLEQLSDLLRDLKSQESPD